MDIQTQTSPLSNTAPQQALPPKAQSALSSDFETFLLMLTTQMQNQDPLNPIESQDFAVQLATFSGVEQQVRSNQLLESLAEGLGTAGIAQLAGWIGMEARVNAPAAFESTPITIAPSADPGSDAAVLVVRDATGREVSRESVPLGVETIDWAGVGPTGAPLVPGLYTFELESLNQGKVTSVQPVSHYAMVQEARQGIDGVDIVVAGGASVPSAQVSALRMPQGGDVL
jgi:flagellar basal-body rod modification protein FlgD